MTSNFERFQLAARRFAEGDDAGTRELLHDDLVFINVGGSDTPWHDAGSGPDGFLQFLRDVDGSTVSESMEFLNHFDDGDLCVIIGHERLRIRSTGVVLDIPIIWETRWKDGKLAFLREYYDTKKLNDAFLSSSGN